MTGYYPWRQTSKCVSEQPQKLGRGISIKGHTVLTGSCSWTDRTLVSDADWYPRRTMSAEERLRFYASQFPLTEIDSTYYAPPAEQQARLWAERTPAGFRFDVKAYSLLTGHPTSPRSLWRGSRSAAERFRYLYSEEELAELARQIEPVLSEAREAHPLMNNCYRDYSVRNAAQLRDLLEASAQ